MPGTVVIAGASGLVGTAAVESFLGAGYEVIAKGFLLLMFGVPVYVYMKYQRSKETHALVPDSITSTGDPVRGVSLT